jgi:hypothetical protein
MELVNRIRGYGLQVPNVDPNDGGVEAAVLVLLESPGPRAVASSFVSRDNPDPSARNMGTALGSAGFHRSETVLWNVVPQCVSTIEKNQNATAAQIRAAAPDTQAFIDKLEKLRVVILCGRKAQLAKPFLRLPLGMRLLETFHTGAMSYNHRAKRDHIRATFREARLWSQGSDTV